MNAYIRLQDMTSVSSNRTQAIDNAIDVLPYKTLVVVCRKGEVGTVSSTLGLQHAAVLEEDAFVDYVSGTFDLTITTTQVNTYQNLLRYVRWKTTNIAGTPVFLLDVVANES